MEQLYLSRRNLQALISKLDRVKRGEHSECTLIKYRNPQDPRLQSMDAVSVTAVENEEYYAVRDPGELHPADDPSVI